jgi:hypothetical protein
MKTQIRTMRNKLYTLCQCELCIEFRREYSILIRDMIGEIDLTESQYTTALIRSRLLTTIPHIIQQKKTVAFKTWFKKVSKGLDFDKLIA